MNDFVASSLVNNEIELLSDGTPWRPLINVWDMAKAFEWAMLRYDKKNFLSVNVGSDEWNYRVIDLANMVHFSVTVNDPLVKRKDFPLADRLITSDIDFTKMEVGPQTYVVVVTQHKGDQNSIKKALEGNGPYIGLVASAKRSKLVFQYLLDEGVSNKELRRVFAPAGFDFACTSPEEIALSIISQIVNIRRGGTGKPMTEVKKK